MARDRVVFSTSFLVAVVVLAAMVALVVGRVSAGGQQTSQAGPGRVGTKRVDVIIKATDSAFWQSMLAGAQRASQDLGVEIGRFGPTSETDIAEQVQLVENSVSRGVDAIVLAANSATALNTAITAARAKGIKVITIDGQVTAKSEGFIGTDNMKAGEQGGLRLCELIKAKGKTAGKVLMGTAVAGVRSLSDRDVGFEKGLRAACPRVTVAQHRYNNNDVATAASQTNDAITAIPDLVGIFAGNNMTGNGVARSIRDNKAADRIPVVAFDSDPTENAALADGSIDALIVQNPYFFGYQGVVEAASASVGSPVPSNLDPGAVVVDRKNMTDPAVRRLLNPPKLGASK